MTGDEGVDLGRAGRRVELASAVTWFPARYRPDGERTTPAVVALDAATDTSSGAMGSEVPSEVSVSVHGIEGQNGASHRRAAMRLDVA